MSKRRVVITGLGIVSPVGSSVDTAWANITAGKSGIRPITNYDVSEFSVKFAGTVQGFDPEKYITPKNQKKMDAFIHYGIGASIDALADSGLEITEENAERIGVSIGSGIGGIGGIERNHIALLENGPRKISPFFVPSSIINMISGNLSIILGLKGPNVSTVTACTTGTHNIGNALRMISYGDADVMFAGGAEMSSTPLGLGGFAAARALSKRNDSPETASRPWDKDRDGFVLGDGAGVVVVEELEHAKARGANIYCEIVGFGMSGDAFHMTLPSKGGEGAARCMRNAMNDAGVNPEEIDYVNAHGTSTPAGDLGETLAIKTAFGDHAHKVAVSSTKSMTGHLLGAAGGVEAVFSILAMRDSVIPPTINLENPSEDCDLDYVPNQARDAEINLAMSNSFGFGGTNGTLIFKKHSA
ncbi:MAG TPA: beta-ketoacyl-[acyl-carrier-protein] synthase II [Gammaproteobacteria bacterium]|nr:beta-ketoacyl-[acyl-carrier-protein] synthase II [Gammaproteobacteria bacterium]